jgi:glycerol-3-phosphate acyltransferase PlsY
MTAFLLTAAFSYLLGSIPFGYILVRIFRRQDIRQTGSGNIGATNVARSSPILGVLTLLFDASKGYAAVMVTILASRLWVPEHTLPLSVITLRAATAALFAILGHMFPLWLRFRGGKGVATGLGSFLVLAPKAVLATVAIFATVVLVFRYVSLGSILAVALFPMLAWLLCDYHNLPIVLAVMGLASILIVFKHCENIRRLLAGTERRLSLRRR